MSNPALPGTWDGLVVIGAGTSWDGVWFPEKHIAHRLADYAPVLYVDPPISPMTALRNPGLAGSLQGPRLRLIRPGLARLTPVVLPGMHRPGMWPVTQVLTRRAVRRAVASLTTSVRAVVVATSANLFNLCGEARRVMYATDDFVAGADLMGVPVSRARRVEARQAREADVAVAISTVLEAKWRALGPRTVLVPNGCDDQLFAGTDEAPMPTDVDLEPPVAGFVGHLSDRIDIALLEAVAARGRPLLLVGPRQPTFELDRMESLLARPNVRWVGPKPFDTLPSYLRVIDVGLTPYADTAFNRASFPLKTLEYLAAGRAVVASDLPAARWLEDPAVALAPASAPEAYADAVEAALVTPRPPDVVAHRRALAARHSWAVRTADMARVLGVATCAPVPAGREDDAT